MARKKRLKLPLLFLLCLTYSTVSAIELTDLGTLGGTWSTASAINDSDKVVGESARAGDEVVHMFLYTKGQLSDVNDQYGLGPPNNYVAWGNDINNRGQIAANTLIGHAAILSGGHVFDLGASTNTYSVALGVNDFGQVVGLYDSPDGLAHAFSCSEGVVTALGPFGPTAISVAASVNNLGMVVGSATDSYLIEHHAFLYAGGVMQAIGPTASYAFGINNSGQVVGEYFTNQEYRAFVYSNGVFTDIGQGSAYGINDFGVIVGTTLVAPAKACRECYEPHAFVYQNGTMTDLNSLLPANSEMKLVEAYGINRKGKIVGYGLTREGQYHAFLLKL